MRVVLAAAALAVAAGCSATGSEATGTSPSLEERLLGAWLETGTVTDGVEHPFDDGTFSVLVFHAGSVLARAEGAGVPRLADVCRSRDWTMSWRLSDDGSSIQVAGDAGPVWTIVTLDEKSLTFEEDADHFSADRLGSCD